MGPATTIEVPCNPCGVRLGQGRVKKAEKVEVRTPQQAEAELALRLQAVVATPQQVGLFQDDPPLVIITGPPGTGQQA